jgi:hypothetical protein
MGKEYLNNKVFEEIIHRFRATKDDPERRCDFAEVQMELTKAFYTLAENIIRAFKFQHVDRDEALQEGVMICFEKLHRFDPRLGKAFPFCTTIILNHYRQLYRAAKHYHELKIKYHQHLSDKATDPHIQALKAKHKTGMLRRMNASETD